MKTILKTLLLMLVFATYTVVCPSVVYGDDAKAKTEVVKGEVAKTAPVEAPGDDATTPVVETKLTENDIPEEPELPVEGTTFWGWVLWLIGVIGITNIVRLIFRLIPTNSNVDWIGKIVQIINILLGAWLPNSENGGATFTRNYSLPKKE